MTEASEFKLTYATMFNPPEEMHTLFEQALEQVTQRLGRDHAMLIGGTERMAAETFTDRTPIDTAVTLGIFPKGTAEDALSVVAAAKKAFPAWSRTPWQRRAELLRKAAAVLDRRIYEVGAVLSLEVGKNRLEALADAAESADLIRYAAEQLEANEGFVRRMKPDPLVGFTSTNTSVMLPYGPWLVISPFNFPCALTAGPVSSALAAGNTVIVKPASDTPWAPKLLVECLQEAGFPEGVVNFVTGPGSTLGEALISSPDVAGITFTGSYDVGMSIYRRFTTGQWVRPIILELGGKNAVIVSNHADLEEAAVGIVRSAFGLQGQKCSACSRIFAEDSIHDKLLDRIVTLTRALKLGDPTRREISQGPVINQASYKDFKTFSAELARAGEVVTGGDVLAEGDFSRGYFCQPTVVADLPLDHACWKQELFLPITCMARVHNLDEAMQLANSSIYGLTAGFYGAPDEADWFFDHIESGTVYANRPQGATTGAWPGHQPFGGWKSSGATGKNVGGPYYLAQYMHEQSRTVITKNR